MNKYLITGFSGFVAKHFLDYLENSNESAVVTGVDINTPEFPLTGFKNIQCSFVQMNLLNADEVKKLLHAFQPDYILHLASYSSVAYSWVQPVEAFVNNLNIFLNLVDQVRLLKINCRFLSVGSSEEYGKVNPSDLPLVETMQVNPLSPYAVARVSQEQLSEIYCTGYNLDIIMTRSFNHIGPGQLPKFAIPSFVKKLLSLKPDDNKIVEVGNIDIIRDFVDVRDVVRAYYLLLKQGRRGAIYNICSGKGTSLREILLMLMKEINISAEIVVDKNLVRPNDNEIIVGSYEKLRHETGWEPQYNLSESLSDIIRYFREMKL